jgi:lipoyl(octanoyl) transferase
MHNILVRDLGVCDYAPVWQAMREFSAARTPATPDEIWLLQHAPVFTLGLNAKPVHLVSPGAIPVLRSDRGGQVTYHGPGQLVCYTLLDLRRGGLGVRQLVGALEQAVIAVLAGYGITGKARANAPGVYVHGAKIAALGLRVRQGRSYHGLSLNVAMDLTPFERIHPCGYPDLRVTDLCNLGVAADMSELGSRLCAHIEARLNSTSTAYPLLAVGT